MVIASMSTNPVVTVAVTRRKGTSFAPWGTSLGTRLVPKMSGARRMEAVSESRGKLAGLTRSGARTVTAAGLEICTPTVAAKVAWRLKSKVINIVRGSACGTRKARWSKTARPPSKRELVPIWPSLPGSNTPFPLVSWNRRTATMSASSAVPIFSTVRPSTTIVPALAVKVSSMNTAPLWPGVTFTGARETPSTVRVKALRRMVAGNTGESSTNWLTVLGGVTVTASLLGTRRPTVTPSGAVGAMSAATTKYCGTPGAMTKLNPRNVVVSSRAEKVALASAGSRSSPWSTCPLALSSPKRKRLTWATVSTAKPVPNSSTLRPVSSTSVLVACSSKIWKGTAVCPCTTAEGAALLPVTFRVPGAAWMLTSGEAKGSAKGSTKSGLLTDK
ncbi:MAG TPA: LPXTG cell wall anchor domain-containing protein [Armatimonadetes bacterium]|nr:LPXTG cell wall anchor domain-containing protein [Armatimonadota bacterium]